MLELTHEQLIHDDNIITILTTLRAAIVKWADTHDHPSVLITGNGLCSNFARQKRALVHDGVIPQRYSEFDYDEDCGVFADLFTSEITSWPHYSGFLDYPIVVTPGQDCGELYWNTEDKYQGEQLRLRLSLLDHIIDSLHQQRVSSNALQNRRGCRSF